MIKLINRFSIRVSGERIRTVFVPVLPVVDEVGESRLTLWSNPVAGSKNSLWITQSVNRNDSYIIVFMEVFHLGSTKLEFNDDVSLTREPFL